LAWSNFRYCSCTPGSFNCLFYQGKPEKQTLTLSDISENYADVEFYYTSSINQQTKKLTDLCEKYGKDDQTLNMLLKELQEYDHTYEQICSDLNAVPVTRG
jgi:hypothetical protein